MLVYYAKLPAESVGQQCDRGVDEPDDQLDLLDDTSKKEDSTPIQRVELWRNSLRMASAVCGQGQKEEMEVESEEEVMEVASSSLSVRAGSGAGHKRKRDDVDEEAYDDAPASKRRRLEVPGQEVGASVAAGRGKFRPLMNLKVVIYDKADGSDNSRRKRGRAERRTPVCAPDSSMMRKVILPQDKYTKQVSGSNHTGDWRASVSRTRTEGKGRLPQDRYMQVRNSGSFRWTNGSSARAHSGRTYRPQAMPAQQEDLRNRLSRGRYQTGTCRNTNMVWSKRK